MSNYLDFAPWATTAGGSGGDLIQIREDNKTAQIPYKLFSGQTKSFYVTSPAGTIIEYSENGTDWKYLTVDDQSRFFEATDALYLNGSTYNPTFINGGKTILDIADQLPSLLWDKSGNLYSFDTASQDIYIYDYSTETWVGTGRTMTNYSDYAYDETTGKVLTAYQTDSTIQVWDWDKIMSGESTTYESTITLTGYSAGRIDTIGGDLCVWDGITGLITRFDGLTSTVKDTVNIGTGAWWVKDFKFDIQGNLVVWDQAGDDKLTVFDGFSADILYTINVPDTSGSTGLKLSVDKVTGDIAFGLFSTSTGWPYKVTQNFRFLSMTDRNINQPCILLMESE